MHRGGIEQLLNDTAPDAVVHLAAITGGIGANRAAPGTFFDDNEVMGIELLEACRTHQIDKVVIAGTVCSYPEVHQHPLS